MRFQNLAIRWKLIIVIMLGSLSATLLAGSVFFGYQLVQTRKTMVRQVGMIAQIVGSNCTASLAFDKPRTAAEILSSLKNEQDITAACVFSRDGKIFASYSGGEAAFGFPSARPSTGEFFDSQHLLVVRPIALDEEVMGTICVWASLDRIRQQIRDLAGTACLAGVVALAVAFLFSTRLQRPISQPVAELVLTANTITQEQDFSLRASGEGEDEIGRLVSSFNRMLTEIENRESALHKEIEERIHTAEALRQSEKDYRGLFENAHDAILIFDPETEEVLELNGRACTLYGFSREEFLGKSLMSISKDPQRVDFRIREKLEAGAAVSFLTTQYRCDGTEIVLDINASLVTYKGRTAVLSLNRDVTERVRAEAALKKSEERYALAARAANDGLWDWDLESGKIFLSPRWKEIIGYEPGELPDVPDTWLNRIHPDDVDDFRLQMEAHTHGLTSSLSSEFRILHNNGEYRWVLSRGLVVFEGGRAGRMAGSMADITDRKRAEERLVHSAFHDALTQLPNRVLFIDRLRHVISRNQPERGASHPFAVLYFDLDRFKVINDSLGHEIGDRFLAETGHRLARVIRPSDTAARLGGDEFAVLLEDMQSQKDAMTVAERALDELSQPLMIGGQELRTSPSIGIAIGGGPGLARPEELIRGADLAMYAAKRKGTGIEIYDSRMHEEVAGRLLLETELHVALAENQFFLNYQPFYSIPSGQLAGFEALLRWQHPRRGTVLPGHFISVLEETRMVLPLTRWLISESCRKLWEWNANRRDERCLLMSVNVSAIHFGAANLVAEVAEVIAETGVDSRWLGIEVTESALMENPEAAERQMGALQDMGVQTIIDDFGTGYSSLAYLSRLPFDKLKIDRSFVARMGSDKRSHGIVRAITTLAHDLGKELVAEGVETTDQLAMLKSLGCEYAQGFLLSRPLPEENARSLAFQLENAGPGAAGGRP